MSRIRMRKKPTAFPAVTRSEGVAAAPKPRTGLRSVGWVVVPTTVAALGASVFVNVVPPRYTGEATIVVENRDRADAEAPIDENTVAGQVRAMLSRDIARDAVKRLRLVGNPEFDPTVEGLNPLQQLMLLLGIGGNPLDRPADDRVIDAYFDHLRVQSAGNSRDITVSFESTDATFAADAANIIAQLSVAALDAGRTDPARAAVASSGGNVGTLRRRVAEAEAKVEAYRAKNGLVGGSAAGAPLTAQQYADVSNQLSQARIQRADIAGRVTAIKEMMKDGRSFEVTDIANNEVLRRTVDNRITVRAQLALESRTLLPAHPRIKALKAQLEDLDAQVKIAAERAVRTLENDAKLADARVASLQSALDGQQTGTAKGSPNDAELRTLERDARIQREQLDGYLARMRETSARDGRATASVDARISAQAVVPSLPTFPRKVPFVALATLAAFLLSLGAAMARALLSRPGRGSAAVPERDHEPHDRTQTTPGFAMTGNPFVLPEAMPARQWAAASSSEEELPAQDSAEPEAEAASVEAAAVPHEETVAEDESAAEPETSADGFDLLPLFDRLVKRKNPSGVPHGRTVVLMETQEPLTDELPAALADVCGRAGSVLVVDLGGKESDEAGFTDIVSGDADFVEVIHSDGPGGAHRVAAGFAGTDVLFDEARAVALTLEAMAEAYDWVICRLRPDANATDLLGLVATLAHSVVIASNADPADENLAELYAVATEAGAGQVLIAQDRLSAEPNPSMPASELEMEFPEPRQLAA